MISEVVTTLQGKLQESLSKHKADKTNDITWSWVCVELLQLVSNYPSGVTEAIILSELHSKFLSGGARLNTAQQNQSRSTVSHVLDTRGVEYESVLQVCVTNPHEITDTTTKIVHLVDFDGDGNRHLKMYLHRKFYDKLDVLKSHTVRLTCCHLKVTASSGTRRYSNQLALLPTEHMVVVVKHQEVEEKFVPLWPTVVREDITQPNYIQDIYAKAIDIGNEDMIHSPDGSTFRRLIVQLEYAEGERIPLVLWDSYIGFARLFDKGDVLYIERPYAKPTGSNTFCLEYGPATIIHVAPYEPEQEIVPSQHPKQMAPITVKRTEDGKLDFNSFPEMLAVSDVVPNMINGVMLVMCEKLRKKELFVQSDFSKEEKVEKFVIEVCDNSGSIKATILDPGLGVYETLNPNQYVVMTGISSVVSDHDNALELCCHLGKGAGTIINVSSLPGLLMSPAVCSHMPLKSACCLSLADRNHFISEVKLSGWYYTHHHTGAKEALKPVRRVHCSCKNEVKEEDGDFHCLNCRVTGLVQLQATKVVSDQSQCWRWNYSLGMVLEDNGGSSQINASITSTVAEIFLQKSPLEVSCLSGDEVNNLLDSFTGMKLFVSITRVDIGQFQVNSARLVY